MFDYIKFNNIDHDGVQSCSAYERFDVDKNGLWIGTVYVLRNNHKNQSWTIEYWKRGNFVPAYQYSKIVDSGKGEILEIVEFKKWLAERNVMDGYMDFLRNHPEYAALHPKAMGVEHIAS